MKKKKSTMNGRDSVETRLESIIQRLEKLEDGKKELWPKFKLISPLISTLFVALIGLWVTYSITGAIEKERLDLSHLTAMRELLITLGEPGVEKEKAEAAGVLLGAFGSRAVAPLIHELGMPGEIRPLAAREGLRAAAFNDPEKTVKILIRVLENRNGLFSWQTHREVILVLGEIGAREALAVLGDMRDLLTSDEGKKAYQGMVRAESMPGEKNLNSLHNLIVMTIQKLEN